MRHLPGLTATGDRVGRVLAGLMCPRMRELLPDRWHGLEQCLRPGYGGNDTLVELAHLRVILAYPNGL